MWRGQGGGDVDQHTGCGVERGQGCAQRGAAAHTRRRDSDDKWVIVRRGCGHINRLYRMGWIRANCTQRSSQKPKGERTRTKRTAELFMVPTKWRCSSATASGMAAHCATAALSGDGGGLSLRSSRSTTGPCAANTRAMGTRSNTSCCRRRCRRSAWRACAASLKQRGCPRWCGCGFRVAIGAWHSRDA